MATLEQVAVTEIAVHGDKRGVLAELSVHPGGPRCHVALTLPGHTRGNHRHERRTEHLVVFGPARVRLADERRSEQLEIAPGRALRLRIPPGIDHAVTNTGTDTGVLVAWHDAPPRADADADAGSSASAPEPRNEDGKDA